MRSLNPTTTHTVIFPIKGMEECHIWTQDGRMEARDGELSSCPMVESTATYVSVIIEE
jgi:hypothetical protein